MYGSKALVFLERGPPNARFDTGTKMDHFFARHFFTLVLLNLLSTINAQDIYFTGPPRENRFHNGQGQSVPPRPAVQSGWMRPPPNQRTPESFNRDRPKSGWLQDQSDLSIPGFGDTSFSTPNVPRLMKSGIHNGFSGIDHQDPHLPFQPNAQNPHAEQSVPLLTNFKNQDQEHPFQQNARRRSGNRVGMARNTQFYQDVNADDLGFQERLQFDGPNGQLPESRTLPLSDMNMFAQHTPADQLQTSSRRRTESQNINTDRVRANKVSNGRRHIPRMSVRDVNDFDNDRRNQLQVSFRRQNRNLNTDRQQGANAHRRRRQRQKDRQNGHSRRVKNVKNVRSQWYSPNLDGIHQKTRGDNGQSFLNSETHWIQDEGDVVNNHRAPPNTEQRQFNINEQFNPNHNFGRQRLLREHRFDVDNRAFKIPGFQSAWSTSKDTVPERDPYAGDKFDFDPDTIDGFRGVGPLGHEPYQDSEEDVAKNGMDALIAQQKHVLPILQALASSERSINGERLENQDNTPMFQGDLVGPGPGERASVAKLKARRDGIASRRNQRAPPQRTNSPSKRPRKNSFDGDVFEPVPQAIVTMPKLVRGKYASGSQLLKA